MPLFSREGEREELEDRLRAPPDAVTLLVGPVSCGKTALLNQVVADVRARGQSVFHVNCRTGAFLTPEEYARELQLQARALLPPPHGWPEQVGHFFLNALKLAPPPPTSRVDFTTHAAALARDALPLSNVITVFTAALEAAVRGGAPFPVLVIDEAQRLRAWPAAEGPLLSAFLQFFVSCACLPACGGPPCVSARG